MSRKKQKTAAAPQKTHHVYVIELPIAVAQDRKFREQNPNYTEGQICLYVGRTGLSPEERFEQHSTKHKKAAKPCKKYGVIKLRPDLYEGLNPMSYDDSLVKEPEHAQALREKGFGVWQN